MGLSSGCFVCRAGEFKEKLPAVVADPVSLVVDNWVQRHGADFVFCQSKAHSQIVIQSLRRCCVVCRDRRSVNMLMKPQVRGMRRDMRFQAGSGFQPVIDVMTGQTVALFVKVVGVLTDDVFAGFLRRSG